MKKLKKEKITIILIIILIIVLSTISYAIYKNQINVAYKATTGEMVCDVEIDRNANYIINGIPYFYVKVRNYETDQNQNQNLTAVNLEYSLTIKNKTGSSGLFIWQKETENIGISSYLETITTTTSTFEKTAKEDIYKVFVRTQSNSLPDDVEIDVELNAVQRNM